jgi:hypothetical protein
MNNDFLNPGSSDKGKSGSVENVRQFDRIPLPSCGKLYPGGEPKELEVYYLTAKEEDILTSPNLIQSGKLFDTLLKSVIKDKSIDPQNLLSSDRNSILIWLRSTGYGSDYEVKLNCRECGHEHVHTFMLDQLEDKLLTEEADQNGLFEVELPISKKTIKFKLLTGKDEQKLYNSKNGVTDRYQLMIKSVDGNDSAFYIRDFVNTMVVKDSKAFRQKVLEIEPGTIMEQDVTCPSCDHTGKEVIPLGINFFYPEYGV